MLKLLLLMTGVAGPIGAIVTAGATVFQAAIAFFGTTLGKYVGAALIGLALFAAGSIHRAHQDAERWAAAVAESQEAAKARDAEVAKRVSADAQERIASLQALTESLQSKVEAYEKALSEPSATVAPVAGKCPATACRLGAGDVQRLLKLK